MFDLLALVKILFKEREHVKERMIKVRFPSMAGDTDRTMTIQELKQEYKDYLIIDPRVGEQVNLETLANLEDIQEVVAMPPISGGQW